MKSLVALACAAGCGGATGGATTTAGTVLAQLAVGCDVGVVSQGGALYVFDRDRVTVVRDGEAIARAGMPGASGKAAPWEAAAAIGGPDGRRWAVGLAGGELWRITSAGELELVGERLGLAGMRVLAIDGHGGTFAIGLAGGAAVSRDGRHVMRFQGENTEHVAAARDRIALAHGTRVDVLDLARGTSVSYRVGTIDVLAFLDASSEAPRLVVASQGLVYVENRRALRKLAVPDRPRQLAVSGGGLWLLGERGLYVIAGGTRRVATAPAGAPRIFGTTAGDVWLASGGPTGTLSRYSIDGAVRASWQAIVAPVFERACSPCHRAGGRAEIDLSTPAAWLEQADGIRHELVARSMPPPDAEVQLGDADRRALERWLQR